LRKKEAEQDAAKVAYEFLLARRGDYFADVQGLIEKVLLSDFVCVHPSESFGILKPTIPK
jgi:hypothetical protein